MKHWIWILFLCGIGLAACGSDSGSGETTPDPAVGNQWDQMKWDQGKWG